MNMDPLGPSGLISYFFPLQIVKIVIWIISSQDSGYGEREECKESMVFGFSIKLRFNSLNSHVGV